MNYSILLQTIPSMISKVKLVGSRILGTIPENDASTREHVPSNLHLLSSGNHLSKVAQCHQASNITGLEEVLVFDQERLEIHPDRHISIPNVVLQCQKLSSYPDIDVSQPLSIENSSRPSDKNSSLVPAISARAGGTSPGRNNTFLDGASIKNNPGFVTYRESPNPKRMANTTLADSEPNMAHPIIFGAGKSPDSFLDNCGKVPLSGTQTRIGIFTANNIEDSELSPLMSDKAENTDKSNAKWSTGTNPLKKFVPKDSTRTDESPIHAVQPNNCSVRETNIYRRQSFSNKEKHILTVTNPRNSVLSKNQTDSNVFCERVRSNNDIALATACSVFTELRYLDAEEILLTYCLDNSDRGTVIWNSCTLSPMEKGVRQDARKRARDEDTSSIFRDRHNLNQHVSFDESDVSIGEPVSKRIRRESIRKRPETDSGHEGDGQNGLRSAEKLCTICFVPIGSKTNLRRHMLCHSGDTKHICSICGVKFNQKRGLMNHLHYCPRLLKRKYADLDLTSEKPPEKRHKKLSETEKQSICPQCQKTFKVKSSISRHIQIVHKIQKLFICRACGRRFSTFSNMQVHQLSHTCTQKFAEVGEKNH